MYNLYKYTKWRLYVSYMNASIYLKMNDKHINNN